MSGHIPKQVKCNPVTGRGQKTLQNSGAQVTWRYKNVVSEGESEKPGLSVCLSVCHWAGRAGGGRTPVFLLGTSCKGETCEERSSLLRMQGSLYLYPASYGERHRFFL